MDLRPAFSQREAVELAERIAVWTVTVSKEVLSGTSHPTWILIPRPS